MFEEYIPDISAYLEAWQKLTQCTYMQQVLNAELDALVANIYLECTRDNKFFINGKPPAISLISASYAVVGNSAETTDKMGQLKSQLFSIAKETSNAKAEIKVEEMKLSLYQTMSANSRNVVDG